MEAARRNAVEAIERNGPRTRGVVVLGLFLVAARFAPVKRFAARSTNFGGAARAVMSAEAGAEITMRSARLCGNWDKARAVAREDAA